MIMIVFTTEPNQIEYADFELQLSELRFQNSSLARIPMIPPSIEAEIYPNPVHDKVNLQFATPSNGEVVIKVFDNSGKNILALNKQVRHGTNNVKLDLSQAGNGVYYYQILSQIEEKS